MPVSPALQKYFDAKKPKKDDTQKKLAAIAEQIDPAFMLSFDVFRDKILGIVDDYPESESLVWEELEELQEQLESSQRKHDMKKMAAFLQ